MLVHQVKLNIKKCCLGNSIRCGCFYIITTSTRHSFQHILFHDILIYWDAPVFCHAAVNGKQVSALSFQRHKSAVCFHAFSNAVWSKSSSSIFLWGYVDLWTSHTLTNPLKQKRSQMWFLCAYEGDGCYLKKMLWNGLFSQKVKKITTLENLISGCWYFNSIFISKIVNISQHLFTSNENLH